MVILQISQYLFTSVFTSRWCSIYSLAVILWWRFWFAFCWFRRLLFVIWIVSCFCIFLFRWWLRSIITTAFSNYCNGLTNFYCVPSSIIILETPASSETTSTLTLSVSNSTIASPLSTLSPTCFNHSAMVPFCYSSANSGTFTSGMLNFPLVNVCTLFDYHILYEFVNFTITFSRSWTLDTTVIT